MGKQNKKNDRLAKQELFKSQQRRNAENLHAMSDAKIVELERPDNIITKAAKKTTH